MQRKSNHRLQVQRFGRQRGLTLVELMVALTIGLVLMLGVTQLFSNMREAYTLNESLSRVQENGRFSTDYISRSLRSAGHRGCSAAQGSKKPAGHGAADGSEFLDEFAVSLHGSAFTGTLAINSLTPEAGGGSWSPQLPNNLSDDVISGSDVITVRYMNPSDAEAAQPGDQGQGNQNQPTFDVPEGHGFESGDMLLLSDCIGNSVMAPLVNSSSTQLTFGAGQFPPISNPVEVSRVVSESYYLGRNPDTGIPGLRRSVTSDGNSFMDQELVPGVEVFRVQYGIDQNGNRQVDSYRTADWVESNNRWDRVRSARFSVLVRSESLNSSMPSVETINILGEDVDINVGQTMQRRVFSSTVQFRNL